MRAEEMASPLEVDCADAVGEKAEVPDARESRRNDVHREAAQELDRRQSDLLLSIVIGIVTPGERDARAVEGEDAPIGDGDAMSVGSQIRQHVLGAAERRLDIRVPVGPARSCEQQVQSGGVGGDVGRQHE